MTSRCNKSQPRSARLNAAGPSVSPARHQAQGGLGDPDARTLICLLREETRDRSSGPGAEGSGRLRQASTEPRAQRGNAVSWGVPAHANDPNAVRGTGDSWELHGQAGGVWPAANGSHSPLAGTHANQRRPARGGKSSVHQAWPPHIRMNPGAVPRLRLGATESPAF